MNAVATGFRTVLWIGGLALGVLLLSSLLRQPLTVAQAAGLSIFAGLALVRPADALLVFAAFGPLVGVLTVILRFSLGSTRLLEAAVLLLLVPWIAVQGRQVARASWRALDWALLGVAGIVVASAAAHFPAVALRRGEDSVAGALWDLLSTEYLAHPSDAPVITSAVLLLEGLGLCALVSRAAANADMARRLAGMVIAGAVGAALMNIYRLFEVALRRGSVTETIVATFTSLRINTQFGDLNAAGSYFAMSLVAAVGLAGVRSRRGAAHFVAAVPLAVAVWLSGSRSALASAALGILGTLVVCHKDRAAFVIRSRKWLLALAAFTVALVAVLTILSKARNNTLQYSVFARAELTATAFRMLGDRPVLGVGVSRFYELFPQYASPELRQAFFESAVIPVTHENAHNNFLQILAELGIVGFAAFLLVLWLALRPDKLGVDPTGVRAASVLAVGTFLFTALLGHPLLTHQVAYPFWMVLGLAAAGAPDLGVRLAARLRLAISATFVLLVATAPSRAGYERRHANLEGVALGMSNWHRDESGNRFRWAGSQSTLFVDPGSPVVRLPMRAAPSTTCAVEIRIDGRLVDRVTVPSDLWQELRLRFPASRDTRGAYRLDLTVDGCTGEATSDPSQTIMVGRPSEAGGASGPAPR